MIAGGAEFTGVARYLVNPAARGRLSIGLATKHEPDRIAQLGIAEERRTAWSPTSTRYARWRTSGQFAS